MTPTQLRAFHLVAESGSFSAAARASGLSQPNLSGQVTALEKAYGVRLFDRGGRSVTPTETAKKTDVFVMKGTLQENSLRPFP